MGETPTLGPDLDGAMKLTCEYFRGFHISKCNPKRQQLCGMADSNISERKESVSAELRLTASLQSFR